MIIHHIFLSRAHSYFGQEPGHPNPSPMFEVESVECVADRGLRGDRFFDHKPDYKGQITFFAMENLRCIWEELGVESRDPSATRRNVILEGADLPSWIGQRFEIQGVQFEGIEECRPCFWMNSAIHQEAQVWLKGRGGLRAKILNDGVLRRGPA